MGFAPLLKPTTPKGSGAEIPEITKLHAALTERGARPNVLTVEQLRRFAPLFQKQSVVGDDRLAALSREYCQLIDFYKPTVVVRSPGDKDAIVTFPPLFTPLRSLPPTDKTRMLVERNTKMAGSDIPRYASAAFADLIQALVNEQVNNQPVIEEYRRAFRELQKQFDDGKALAPAAEASAAAPAADETSTVSAETAWEFEE